MNIYFATYAASIDDLMNNFLLANSIGEFAGNLSEIPLRIYVSSDLDIQNEIERFAGLNVMFSTYPAARQDMDYADKSAAASACEADIKTGNVIWLDRHMIVLGSCVDLLLSPSERFAYRPPHLKLLGASVDEPMSKMWATVYRIAGVADSALFPVYTEVDRQKIWPYFSAGHFSFRAEAGIMREWDALFHRLIEHQEMVPFLDTSLSAEAQYVKIFLHQIALTLAVLKTQSRNALKPLPLFYGYPTHLHCDIDKFYQTNEMDQLHTAFYSCHDGAISNMPVSQKLAAWLEKKVNSYRGA